MKKYLLAIIVTLLYTNLYAQDTLTVQPRVANVDFSYGSSKKYVIEDIVITGLKFVEPSQIEAITGISRGDTISIPGEDLSFMIKKLWMQRYFSEVELKGVNVNGDKVTLEIYLQERPRVSSWSFAGVRKSERTELTEKLHLRRGSELSDYVISTSTDLIKKYFADKGFLNADVSISQENDTILKNMVKVTFNIDKKNKVKIRDIDFEGNKEITDSKLRRAMKDTKRKRLNTIFKSSKFIREKYEEDMDNLIAYYNEKGYRDAHIISDTVTSVSDRRVAINIEVEEGQKYFFRNITWVGNAVFSDEQLNAILGLKKGDVYDTKAMSKMLFEDDQSVMTLHQDLGYLFFYLEPVELNVVADSVDVEMRIVEGDQARFNKIIITGNNRTSERVVRRELLIKPGELYSKTYLVESIRRLSNLQYFDPEKLSRGVQPIPNRSEGTVDVVFNVEEKATDQLEISGGYGNNMFVGTLGVKFSNFSTRRMFEKGAWRPVPSGDGQTLTLRAQTNGSYYRAFSFGFVEPWLGGKKPTSLSISAFHTTETTASYFFQNSDDFMKITGVAVGLGKRLKWPDYNFTLAGELSWQQYKLKNWQYYFIFSDGVSHNLSFKVTLGRSTIDNPIFPREGSEFTTSLQLTPPFSLINRREITSSTPDSEKYRLIEYHKWSFRAATYNRIASDLVLHTKVMFGFLGYYNSDIGYSPFEGYLFGGDGMGGNTRYGQETIGLRGYKNESLTPVVYTSSGRSVSAANTFVKYTAELRYPLIMEPSSTIFVLAFVEGGNAWYNINEFTPFGIRRSAGVGVRLLLPIVGMLGLDWGYGFDKIPGNPDASGGQLHFTLGMPMN